LLTKHHEPKFRNQRREAPPPAEIINNEEEHEVKEVIDKRKRYGRIQYRIRWRGFSREDDTWEPKENLQNAADKLQEFEQRLRKESHKAKTQLQEK